MIGDTYKIKYSDYVLNLDGTDNGRFIEIEATDYTSRPGVNTTNLNHSDPVKRVPLDIVLYGYRSRGYGAPLWNNLFYLLENFAQPSEDTSIFPKYDKNPIAGQIWVDTSFELAVPRWYGRDNTFYKLGASVNIAANASQAAPGELWFDTSVYAFKFYDTGWSDISCIPYASQREYNTLATLANALTTVPGTLPILTGSAKPTPALWGSLVAVVRVLAQANGVLAPTAVVDILAADNFMICNTGVYGVASIKSIFSQIRTSIDAIEAAVNPPTQLPLAGFVPSSTAGTAPMVVNFTDTSTQTTVGSQDTFGPTQYTWDFGDGNTSTTPGNASHTYTTAGSRTVTLTLVNSVGTTSTQSAINIVGAPVAQFLVGPDTNPDVSATAPFALTFTDQSTGSPTSWLWDFGDGTISSDRNPTHTYSTLGDFTVSLLVTNAAGSNTATVTHAVQVGEPTIANFTYTTPTRPTSDTSPFSVTFTDTTTKLPTSWLWNFGDGTTSTQQNPTHTYTSWGRFTVTLTATNVLSNTSLDVGQTSVKTMVDLVNIGLAPITDFTLSTGVGYLPVSVVATDTSVNNPTSWLWDFGDGTTSTAQNPTHAYTTYGTRIVALTAMNAIGSSTNTHNVVVQAPTPVASFSFTPSSGTAPVDVSFTDLSTNTPTSWLWDFGDGVTSTAQNPTHTYVSGGVFSVSLTASNSAGVSAPFTMSTFNIVVPSGDIIYSIGTFNHVVPFGITSMTIQAAGGGGGGGGSESGSTSCSGGGGGGGGGGAWCDGTISVTPGSTIVVTSGYPGGQGGAGGVTTISGPGVYIQLGGGGSGGGGVNGGVGGPGGAGAPAPVAGALTGFAGQYGPGADGGQANVQVLGQLTTIGGCVNGNAGGSTIFASGGAGGISGWASGGGGGGGASRGSGGFGGAGNGNADRTPGAGLFGGGGGGYSDEQYSGAAGNGGVGEVRLSWSAANTTLSGQQLVNPTSYPPAYVPYNDAPVGDFGSA